MPICNGFVSGYSAADSQDSRTLREIKAWQERFRAQNVPCTMQSVSSGCLLAFHCFLFLPPPSCTAPKSQFLPPAQTFQLYSSVSIISGYPRCGLGTGGTSLFLSLSMVAQLSSPFILQRGFCSRALCTCGAVYLDAVDILTVLLRLPLSLWGSCLHLWLLGMNKTLEPVKAS